MTLKLLLLRLRSAQVFQVRARATGKIYAMKVMRKERILQKDHGDYVRAERDLLTAVVHPYIVTMRYRCVRHGTDRYKEVAATIAIEDVW